MGRGVGLLKRLWKSTVAFRETFWIALDTLRAHKLRSFLTLLGVILAVMTLVAVMSVIEGLNLWVSEKVANLGAGVFGVDRFGVITSFEAWVKAQKRPPVRPEELEALREGMTLAQRVGAVTFRRADVRFGNEQLEDVLVMGSTPNYVEIRDKTVANGRFINESDEHHRSPVCFAGPDVTKRFFPNTDPIGKTIRVGNHSYTIIGVAKAQGTVFGQSQDNFVMIPLEAFMKSWATPMESLRVFVQPISPELSADAQDEARVILRARRHLKYNDEDNFGIVDAGTFNDLWKDLTGNVFRIAVGLTSIFMVVGGIVIMNIMLASVVERTREIGIRKSLGARRRHIIMQFLAESALLAATGGLIGIAGAFTIATLVKATGFPMQMPLSAVLIALTLSTGVGLFFGIYPAVRASRLDPIEALRSEV
jgi:putative ABC transport system permease protein